MRKPNHRNHRQDVRSPQKNAIPKNWRCVVGNHALFEAIQCNAKSIQSLWLKQGWESSKDLREVHDQCRKLSVKIEIKPPAELDRLAASHQGAALFLSYTPEANWSEIKKKLKSRIIILDGIEDPHNLGAILRTAWLMKVDAILIPQDRAVGLTPTVHKVACGGAEHVPIVECSNFSNILEELKKDGFWVFGLSHLGKGIIFDLKIPEKVCWAVGAEDKGLRTTTENLCDELVRIPQVSAAASYNASVSAAIALSETLRQQPD